MRIRDALRWSMIFFFVGACTGPKFPIKDSDTIAFDAVPLAVQNTIRSAYQYVTKDECTGELLVSGSAVFLKGRILTAGHVVAGTQWHLWHGGPRRWCIQNMYVSFDKADTVFATPRDITSGAMNDAAMFDAPAAPAQPLCFSAMYSPGDVVYIVGYPEVRGFRLTIISNKIARTFSEDSLAGSGMLTTAGPLGGIGMSGGPVINQKGCIIGILVRLSPADKTNLSTPIANIKTWLSDEIWDSQTTIR